MNLKEFRLIQHNLIPLALIAGNIALGHLIYLLANGEWDFSLYATAISITALTTGIIKSNKYLLLAGTLFYFVILIVGFL